jgi:type II secretion system protein N
LTGLPLPSYTQYTMKRRTKIFLWLGFLLYGLALFCLFSFYRLPADKILAKILETVTHGQVFVSAQRVSSSVWKGYRLEKLTWVVESGGTTISEKMESLTVAPSFLKLFLGYLPIEAEGPLAGGTIRINAGVSMVRGAAKGYASLEASGIRLEDLAVTSLLMQRQIKGKLRGEAEITGSLNDLRKVNGKGTVFVEDGSVETRLDFLGLKTISFSKLTLPLSIRNGVATIKGGQITGPLLTGDLQGRIRIQQDFRTSPLQMTATIRPGPSFRQEQTRFPWIEKDRPLVVRLQGTLGKPFLSLAGGTASQ